MLFLKVFVWFCLGFGGFLLLLFSCGCFLVCCVWFDFDCTGIGP